MNGVLLNQIIKFGFVGGLAFVIDYFTLIFCKELLNMNVLLAALIAFTISVIFNYMASIRWVFNVNKENNSKRNFILFIFLSIVGLIITELIMWVGIDMVNVNYLIVKIIATAVVMIFNFATRKAFLER